jgi:hypothetical protein
MKKAPVTNHISHVKGLRKAQALEDTCFTGATITSPESM